MDITASNRLAFLRDDTNHQINIARQTKDGNKAALKKICLNLAEARATFKADQDFGKWFDASGIDLDKTTRANAIAMGQHPKEMEVAFKEATSTSIQLIYKDNFRVHINMKPTIPTKPVKPKAAPTLAKAIHAIERRKQAGEKITREAIVAEAGVSRGTADTALAVNKATPEIDPSGIILSMSAQEKFDAKVRAFRKNFDYEVETKVRQETNKRMEEWHIPDYMKLLAKVEDMLKWKKGVMSRAEYNKIIRCLHPDTGAHVSDEGRNEAFRLFTKHEAKLVMDNEQADLRKIPPLPRTVAEMEAQRRTKAGRRTA